MIINNNNFTVKDRDNKQATKARKNGQELEAALPGAASAWCESGNAAWGQFQANL